MAIVPFPKDLKTFLSKGGTPRSMAAIIAEEVEHIRAVGPKKPIGHLTLFSDYLEKSPDEYIKEAQEKGLQAEILKSETDETILYVWDENALRALLARNLETLEEFKWPKTPREFVVNLSTEIAPGNTKLFDLVADAYADHLNPGRLYIDDIYITADLLLNLGLDRHEVCNQVQQNSV